MELLDIVPKGFACGRESELIPGDLRWREGANFLAFWSHTRDAADYRCPIHDEDHPHIVIGIDIQQVVEPDLQAGLFTSFPNGRVRDAFPQVYVASWERPAPETGLIVSAQQPNTFLLLRQTLRTRRSNSMNLSSSFPPQRRQYLTHVESMLC